MAVTEWVKVINAGSQELNAFIEALKVRGVREFKGRLYNEGGQVLWDIEFKLERPATKPDKRDSLE